MKNDESRVVIPGDKDSCVIVMDKQNYIQKLEEMIHEGMEKGVYKKANDNTLRDLKRFQDFLYRNFKKHKQYNKMFPISNQPAKLYGTAKTHKFDTIEVINLPSLKFRPIVAQTGTCMYSSAQVISEYLQPLYKDNPFIISNTQDFAEIIRSAEKLKENEQYVSYDVE